MVTEFYNLPDSVDDFSLINEAPTLNPEQSLYFENGLETENCSFSTDLRNDVIPPCSDFGTQAQSLKGSPKVECLEDHESDSFFNFLNQILMEETVDRKPSMFLDPLALQATEKSFYDVIGKKYPPSPIDKNIECPGSLWDETIGNCVDPSWSGDYGFYNTQLHQSNLSMQSSFTSSQPLVHSENSTRCNDGGQIDCFVNMHFNPSYSESKLQFCKGMEEGRKSLPINFTLSPKTENEPPKVEVRVEKHHSTTSRGRKHLHCQDSDLNERSSKHSAVYVDEVELSELFDKVLLRDVKGVAVSSKGDVQFLNGINEFWEQNRFRRVPRIGKAPAKNQGEESNVVSLQNLLLSCAQAVASDDLRNAHEQLKQIRQYASSAGDAYQRVANVFANGLEARLAGTGTQMCAILASKRISASEMLKAYQVYLSACPFEEISTVFANKMILKIAAKHSILHIVDFGISYGFQWPVFIQFLSTRKGGPPKLRITGIDFPQAGFHPAESIEETGKRLAKYCKRFNVPFEFQAIARQCWETIDINDLKLARDEVLVVNCLFRFQHLPEETELAGSPKDGVLKLIRRMKPDLFVHSILNGSYNAPFFMTRFREALFYYASLFDMLGVTLPHNDQQRFHFEKEFYGREVVNIIACEGSQRVVRPETYKQWHTRSIQAGFKIVPKDGNWMFFSKELIQKYNAHAGYHKDFLFDEDCNWMLQGWKGRILYASSCWVPV